MHIPDSCDDLASLDVVATRGCFQWVDPRRVRGLALCARAFSFPAGHFVGLDPILDSLVLGPLAEQWARHPELAFVQDKTVWCVLNLITKNDILMDFRRSYQLRFVQIAERPGFSQNGAWIEPGRTMNH